MRIKQHPELCESKIIVFNSDIYHDMEMNETETQEILSEQQTRANDENADENQAVSG